MKKQVLSILVLFASVSMAMGQISITSPYVAENTGFPWTARHIQQGAEVVFVGTYDTENYGTVDSVSIAVTHLVGWVTSHMNETKIIDGNPRTGQAIDGIIQDTITVPEDMTLSADFPDDQFIFQARVYFDPVYDTYANEWLTLVAGYRDSIAIDGIEGYDNVEQLGDVEVGDTLHINGHYGVKDLDALKISLMQLSSDWGSVIMEEEYVVYDAANNVGHKSGYYDVDFVIPEDFNTSLDLVDGQFFIIRYWAAHSDGNHFKYSYLNLVQLSVTGVSLDQTELGVEVGESKLLTATVEPSTALDQSVTWSSSDPEVAHVENGLVSGLKSGTATVTVTTTDGEFTADCAVTVGSGSVELSGMAGVSAYPNPVKDVLHIDGLESGSYQVAVYNILGSSVMNLEIEGSGMNTISLDELPAGNYLLDVRGEEGRFSQKISK